MTLALVDVVVLLVVCTLYPVQEPFPCLPITIPPWSERLTAGSNMTSRGPFLDTIAQVAMHSFALFSSTMSSSSFPDYYKLLNLSPNATPEEVKQGYRKESLKCVNWLKQIQLPERIPTIILPLPT